MSPCFADAYYFFALLSPRDEAHSQAVAFNATLRRPLVTTAWVLTEVADGLAGSPARNLFALLRRRLASDRRVTIIPPESEVFERGVELYENRSDKRWSLTDCISFVVMRQRGLSEALTADHHFEQAGFTALLR